MVGELDLENFAQYLDLYESYIIKIAKINLRGQ